jgi:hypothetical protein
MFMVNLKEENDKRWGKNEKRKSLSHSLKEFIMNVQNHIGYEERLQVESSSCPISGRSGQ